MMKDQKKIKVQTQWLSLIVQSASNSYLTGNNIGNITPHFKYFEGKYDLKEKKYFTKAGRGGGEKKGIFQFRGLYNTCENDNQS